MKKIEKEFNKVEKLYNETLDLLDKGLIDASLMYCRKIVEGIFLIIQNNEKIRITKNEKIERVIENHIKEKYNFLDTVTFFDNAIYLYNKGTRSTQFNISESDILMTSDEVKKLLDFVFLWFKDYVFDSQIKEETKDLYFNEKNNALPFCIKNIEVENYQSLKKIELKEIPVDSQFIVLTGNNGEGKTSILQTITIGIFGDYDDKANLVLSDKQGVVIIIEGKNKYETFFNEYKGFRNQYSNVEKNNNLIAYGASRLQLQSAESQDLRKQRQSNVYGIFRTDNVLRNIEYWIKMQFLNKQNDRINAVVDLLIDLMPSVERINIGFEVKHINQNEFPITYIENERELKSEQLSAGNKSILAMIGDMIIRLYDSQPETINPRELYGIVLIDELETHLHPKWQKELPKLLTEHFPLIQFIVSTHSPIVFLGMPKNSVFYNISRDENNETLVKKLNIDIENAMPHQILTSEIFDMENIRNVYNKGIENLNIETEQEIKERKEKEENLKKITKGFKFKRPKK